MGIPLGRGRAEDPGETGEKRREPLVREGEPEWRSGASPSEPMLAEAP